MTIWLNGDRCEKVAAANVAELVAELNLASQTTLIEHNGLALRRDEWPSKKLAMDDRIEIVRIVAGG